MKKMLVMVAVIGLIFTGALTVVAGGDNNRGEIGQGDTYENGCVDQPCFINAPKPGDSSTFTSQSSSLAAVLDRDEIRRLVFIREEEKMARDIYLVLYEKWGNPVFANIAESEQTHMDAMANLLAFYGIADPVTSDDTGVFSDQDIETLFLWLKEWGLASEADAFLVGGYIEEFDILDIREAYNETDEERIRQVYQSLCEGSYNHLHAFVYNYELLNDKDYEPQLLTEEEYADVMSFDTQAKQEQDSKKQKGK